jgi:hypothetical protein
MYSSLHPNIFSFPLFLCFTIIIFFHLTVLDSSSLPQSGMLDGITGIIGEYDECLSIEGPKDVTNEPAKIIGQHCMTKLILPRPPIRDEDAPDEPFDDFLTEMMSSITSNSSKSFIGKDNIHKFIRLGLEGINLEEGKTMRIGMCFSLSCRPEDVQYAINQGMNQF